MELGDRVIYYTHDSSDGVHSSTDTLAFVTGIVDDYTLDLVLFPRGGPIRFERVSQWDPETATQVGGSYWREGGDAPDFETEAAHFDDPEWGKLMAKQSQAFQAAPPAEQPKLAKAQAIERKALREKIKAKPVPPKEIVK